MPRRPLALTRFRETRLPRLSQRHRAPRITLSVIRNATPHRLAHSAARRYTSLQLAAGDGGDILSGHAAQEQLGFGGVPGRGPGRMGAARTSLTAADAR